MREKTFLEFFCGGGMARAGLGAGWRCVFANDVDAAKGRAYVANWGDGEFRLGDVHTLRAEEVWADHGGDSPLPAEAGRGRGWGGAGARNPAWNGHVRPLHPFASPFDGEGNAPPRAPNAPDLAWASFPCQDLSLAGAGAGLRGARSSAFFGFRDVIAGLRARGAAPRLLVLENVVGALTSNGGADFSALCGELRNLGYVFGALTIDAALFTPQSRPRLFVIAMRDDLPAPSPLVTTTPCFASPALLRARAALPKELAARWRWWSLPAPPAMNGRLADVIEDEPRDAPWFSREETARLVSLMAPLHRARLEEARVAGARKIGALYRRTRVENGVKTQRAEVRFDGFAGCLRTPGGGSSRQFIVVVENGEVRARLLSSREAARLMGLPDDYVLPKRYGAAYHLLGDGVSVPVVRYLAEHLLAPLCAGEATLAAAE